jgi:hypothetical protein
VTDGEKAVTVWAEIVDEILEIAPGSIRQEIVAAINRRNEEHLAEQKKYGAFRVMSAAELMEGWEEAKRYWHAKMEARSLITQIFVRRIANNHSKDAAAAVLFREHRHGQGGCRVLEYLEDLPGITVDYKRANKLRAGKSKLWFG